MKKSLVYVVFVAVVAFIACSKIDQPERVVNVCKLDFSGIVRGYGDALTKSSTTSWAEGDKVYMLFYKPDSTTVAGTAIYSAADGWTLSYEGNLAECVDAKCEVHYFENVESATDYIVAFNSGSVAYADLNGKYSYSKGSSASISVIATLAPKVSRIRFKGNVADTLHLIGLSSYSTYSVSNSKYSSTTVPVKLAVESDGYTPYVYGYLGDTTYRMIALVTEDNAFTRECESDILQGGDSGYMTIPTKDSYNGWKKGLYMKVCGVEFKMIPVTGDTSGFYLIGETEITKGLYNSVMELSYSGDSEYPKNGTSYRDFTNFISKLNYLTGLTFNLPTREQWLYAAAGGEHSLGFTYSGSNVAGDVAWYSANSNNDVHPVKQKSPNELGIYDMSGNVCEFVLKYQSGGYTYWLYMGGAYKSTESGVQKTSYVRDYDSSSTYYDSRNSYYDCGARLSLTLK